MSFRRGQTPAGGVRAHADFPDSGYRENTGSGTDGRHDQPRFADSYRPAYSAPDESVGSGAASAVAFLAGVWLVISPFVLDFGVHWNDMTIGIVIALLVLVRAMAPRAVTWVSSVNVVLGAWLVATPWVLGYNADTNALAATVSDMSVGVVVVIAAVVSTILTYRYCARVLDEARDAGRRSAATAG